MIPHVPLSPSPRALRHARLARLARLASRGFTLTELTVSLTAGLIVAVGLVGLSREATNSFHEEVRVAAAESGSRTAIDRLRADLQRAGFMSTANIQRDPQIAVGPGQPNVTVVAAAAFPGLAKLAGIHLAIGGSLLTTPLSTVQLPRPLNPDAIYIGGNLTSTDQFYVRDIDQPSGACQRIWLAVDSPSMWRSLSSEFGTAEGGTSTAGAADRALANAFQPSVGDRYIVRFADNSGRFQYAVTCPTATGGASQAAPNPWLDIDSRTPILTAKDTKSIGGATGFGIGTTVNPVSIVKWQITNALPAALAAQFPSSDANEYYLVRSFVNITDPNLAPIVATTEVISEYAVDLKVAFTVDQSPLIGPQAGTAPSPLILPFDNDALNAPWASDVSLLSPMPQTGGIATGPQRIRAVRVRLVTRAAIADRTSNIQPAPANLVNQNFMYRYCTAPPGTDGGTPDCTVANAQIWARSRTVTAEVALSNQQRLFWL